MLLGVDVGGTFTDAVLVDGEGRVFAAKAPTTPDEQDAGVAAAVSAVLERASAHGPANTRIDRFAHGMTVATNALLEGRGARTALLATEGFTDVVELARQTRPSLYRLCEPPPRPLVDAPMRFSVAERTGPQGVVRPLDRERAGALVEELADAAPEAVAVVLLHSYAHPDHERALGELIARRLPGVHLSLSHELVGTFREYERAATTEIDASLSPLLAAYLCRLSTTARGAGLPPVEVMQSSGGLTTLDRAARHAALTVLSGPAGGVGGARLLSLAAGEHDVICFDMGGTSCDVCVIEEGEVAETAERTIGGRPLALPALDIHTVGAGGGSIAWRDEGGALRVGPHSAGAAPGPACYGRGGTAPTVTDANVVLGRLPAEIPLAGGVSLDREAAWRAVSALAADLSLDPLSCAEGIVRVAENEMLGALRVVTVQRGTDPRGFALMPFGGAGPLHAAAMADELGIERVLCPRAGGVLSALGLAAAPPRRDAAATVLLAGAALTRERLQTECKRLIATASDALGTTLAGLRLRFELRYAGQSFELPVTRELPAGAGTRANGGPEATVDPAELVEDFARLHAERYGYRDERAEVELVNIRASAIGAAPAVRLAARNHDEGASRSHTEVVFGGETVEATLWHGAPRAGAEIAGPAVCALAECTLLVPPGWHGTADEHGTIALERRGR